MAHQGKEFVPETKCCIIKDCACQRCPEEPWVARRVETGKVHMKKYAERRLNLLALA